MLDAYSTSGIFFLQQPTRKAKRENLNWLSLLKRDKLSLFIYIYNL